MTGRNRNKQQPSHLIDARTRGYSLALHCESPVLSSVECGADLVVFDKSLFSGDLPILAYRLWGNVPSEWVKEVAMRILHLSCVEFSSLILSSAPEPILGHCLHLDSRTLLAALVTSFRALRQTQEGIGSEEAVAMMLLLFTVQSSGLEYISAKEYRVCNTVSRAGARVGLRAK
jgi:hypothetical protein